MLAVVLVIDVEFVEFVVAFTENVAFVLFDVVVFVVFVSIKDSFYVVLVEFVVVVLVVVLVLSVSLSSESLVEVSLTVGGAVTFRSKLKFLVYNPPTFAITCIV